MSNNIEFLNGSCGIKAIIKGGWQDTYFKLILDKGVQELELNDAKGWCGKDVDFLKFIPNLKSLIIIDYRIKSIDAVHSLSGLVKLRLHTYSKNPVNFSCFPELEQCDFEWINGSESLFECVRLTRLGLNRLDKSSSSIFSKLIHLEVLTLMNSKINNLEGLARLKHIKYLSICNLKHLNSLKGIQDLMKIEELEIQGCKGISSISEVLNLKKLRRLLLIDLGNIGSLKGIECLTELQELLFYESTNIIDGDLTPVTKLKKLSKISYQNRKHYSHKREDFYNNFLRLLN